MLVDAAAARSGDAILRTRLRCAVAADRASASRSRSSAAARGGDDARARIAPHAARYRHELELLVERPLAAARPGTSCSRARPASDGSTARCATPRAGSTTSPSSASTSSTCRRSIRSARRSARAPTTRRPRAPDDPGSPWAIGGPEGGHTRVHPAARHARRLRSLRRRGERKGLEVALDIAFQCSPDHPWVRRAPELVQAAPRRHDPVRRESAEEVPGRLSVRLRQRGLARRCGRRCATCSCSGASAACACSASTTRTPSRSRSGSGASREVQARVPRGDLPRRGVHAAQADVRAREERVLAVVHVLHVAHDEVRARDATCASSRARRSPTSFGRTSGRRRPTSFPSTSCTAAARSSRSA